MNQADYAVILAGGKGERFWPLSTARRPKQFLALVGEKTLLAQAVERVRDFIPPARVFVITNRDLLPAARAAAPELPPENIIGEPVGRDTAAAVALGAGVVMARDPQAAFCVLTADHVIGGLPTFQETLRQALAIARAEDVLITIGIVPDEPSTAYGYVESGAPHSTRGGIRFLRARRFVEKPDLETARRYVADGAHFWNAGMFIWSAKAVQAAFARHRPALAPLIDRFAAAARAGALDAAMAEIYPGLEKISIDYALLEKADNILMAAGEFPWDDVGSWTALANHYPMDDHGNTLVGRCRTHGAEESIVVSPDRLTALVGVKDVIVVQAEGVTLVCARDRAQDIKKMVEQLRRDPELSHLT